MAIKSTAPWIPAEKIANLVHPEAALLLLGLSLAAWIAYKTLLRDVSAERHRNLRRQFNNLSFHVLTSAALFLSYLLIEQQPYDIPALDRFGTYLGVGALVSGAVVFIKVSRILLFEYLFLSHMRVGVPLLLVNLFTLLLTLVTGGWLAAEIFSINFVPVLATSAIFSLVLGLALQETLGNLFAGISLQLDKPFEIGDWIELYVDSQKVVGQVYEISWRATVLQGFADEFITVPNRTMAQSQIHNFATRIRPICRSHVFRLPYDCDRVAVQRRLAEAALGVVGVRADIPPTIIITEAAESWLAYKLVYSIENFGAQYIIGDRVINAAMDALSADGITLASPRVQVSRAAG